MKKPDGSEWLFFQQRDETGSVIIVGSVVVPGCKIPGETRSFDVGAAAQLSKKNVGLTKALINDGTDFHTTPGLLVRSSVPSDLAPDFQ